MLQLKDAIAGALSGFMAGLLVTAIGGRIIMRIIALVDPFTHPRFTVDGTLFLVIIGIAFGAALGAPFGLLYITVQGLLPVPRYWKGLLFGLFLLLTTGGIFFSMDQAEEFTDFDPPLLAVSLFGLLFPIYGVVIEVFTHRFDDWLSIISESWLKIIGYIILTIICLLGLLMNIGVISERL